LTNWQERIFSLAIAPSLIAISEGKSSILDGFGGNMTKLC